MVNNKKLKLILIGILCLLSVGAYGVTFAYKNYQEAQIQQAKEQHKNEQIEQAKEKVKKVVDNKISGMKCEAKYDLKNSSDSVLTITVTLMIIKIQQLIAILKEQMSPLILMMRVHLIML